MENDLTSTSTVTHAEATAAEVISQYLDQFLRDSSIAIISAARFDHVRSNSALAGWYITDCATNFELLPGASAPATSAELLIETSGTTAAPKLVRYRKNVIRTCADAIAAGIPLNQDRDYIALVNPRLAYGLSILHSHLLADVPVRFREAPVTLDCWLEFKRELQPNSSIYMVPHQSFLLARGDSSSCDQPIELIFAGGTFSESMAARLRPVFPNATVVNMYGQAELGPRVSIGRSSLSSFREGDVGKPLPGVDIRVVQRAPDGKTMVEVASPYRMSCYFDLDGGPAAAPPRWWPTGDIGQISANGHLHIAGRDAPDVNFLGGRVQLSHLGDIVRDVDGVLACRVSAVEHAVYGQQPSIKALIEAPDTGAERRIRRALAAEVGTSASAMLVNIVDIAALPESGKL